VRDRRDKKAQRGRIDGIVALAMAVGAAVAPPAETPGVMKMMANWFYLIGSICFIVGTIINMTAQ
jgi:hypothetical protein